MSAEIRIYNKQQTEKDQKICDFLYDQISETLTESTCKIWHAHPVWFINDNPIVGYSKLKNCVRLMFWSGGSFNEDQLEPGTGKFKDASVRYTSVNDINHADLHRWLEKSKQIQWDYKNIVKRKGKLERLI